MEKLNVDINNFIGVYDGFIPDPEIDKALLLYTSEEKLRHTFSRIQSEKCPVIQKKDNQLFLGKGNVDVWSDDLKTLMINFNTALNDYYRQTSILTCYSLDPTYEFSYTSLKIQKTSPGGGYHIWHIETALGKDYSQRALAYAIYLNDIKEGGETEFLHQSVRVSPKKGRIVIWPAGFPYVHRGNPPLKEDKYILTSWMMM